MTKIKHLFTIQNKRKILIDNVYYRNSIIETIFSAGQLSTANDNTFVFKPISAISLCIPNSTHNGHTDGSFLSIN